MHVGACHYVGGCVSILRYGCGQYEHCFAFEDMPLKGKAIAALLPGRAEITDPFERRAEAVNIYSLAKSQVKAARLAARSAAASAIKAAAPRT